MLQGATRSCLDLFAFDGGENLVAVKEVVEKKQHIISNKQLCAMRKGSIGKVGILVHNITGLFIALGPDGGQLLCLHCTGCMTHTDVCVWGLHFFPIWYFSDPELCTQIVQLFTLARKYLIDDFN